MDDYRVDLRATADKIAEQFLPSDSSASLAMNAKAWVQYARSGFTTLNGNEGLGGGGGDFRDAVEVVESAALISAPIGEALLLAVPLLNHAQIPLPTGVFTAAKARDWQVDADGTFSGELRNVSFLDSSDEVVVLGHDGSRAVIALLPVESFRSGLRTMRNLAGEARSSVRLERVTPIAIADLAGGEWNTLFDVHGALLRSLQTAVGMQFLLDETVRYVQEREQFGRALWKFQTVQHRIATMASHALCVKVAARSAVLRVAESDLPERDAWQSIAVAKSEASSLTSAVTEAAHQLHGAIGLTQEHRIGAATKRLWAWREEFGNEQFWWAKLGRHVRDSDAGYWQSMSTI